MLGVAVTPSRWDDAHVVAWSLFFFSSRRRHTRWPRDWSSDVCSSDLNDAPAAAVVATGTKVRPATCIDPPESRDIVRSEERRVGKEWRHRRSEDRYTQLEKIASRPTTQPASPTAQPTSTEFGSQLIL